MVELLGGWLKQIVILVLLATFMDLLLPNHTMERYVKLIMGLLIILAILSPVFQFLRDDLDLSTLIAGKFEETGEETSTSVKTINQKGKDLSRKQDQLIHEQVEQDMAEAIQKDVEKEFKVEVIRSHVKTGEKKDRLYIRKVHLVIDPTTDPRTEKKNEIKPVEEVDTIHIDITEQKGVKRDDNKEKPNRDKKWTRLLADYLKSSWKLDPDQVTVTVTEG
ncbi:stage III sporulation protein AF [Kroppenstedtia pulmonis]|uniref:Stage III sporulation protein AF n=1 Tax=Kroppenstedtia pulmonis TaxID=1380685 RepID=A0A7D4C663_9BACL|nr:stage III sporulation protein AF [Kroppenstedtia pulmonis]QKG84216.1 stage III sporulation protein AF [Kroppenstedtia pulmonis]